jgi:D-3-phosphoglycerate dehydrogenase
MKIAVTCPPMLRQIDEYRSRLAAVDCELVCPNVVQAMTEDELIALLPDCDGWIIGDDPATRRVFSEAKKGRLKAAVKWGVGLDNVDLAACAEMGIAIANTPGMFGSEVADVALGYTIALARHLFAIDRGVRADGWPKPAGMSLDGKVAALVGFGDIGKNTARRLIACGLRVNVYDPAFSALENIPVTPSVWPDRIDEADFILLTCALTPANHGMISGQILAGVKLGVLLVNVSRGPLIDEQALIDALESQRVGGAALDVFEKEPLPSDSPLRKFDNLIFGSHNASNTLEAVRRTSERAIGILSDFLGLNLGTRK